MGPRRGVREPLALRGYSRPTAAVRCLPLCITLAASATLGVEMPAVASPAAASQVASPAAASPVASPGAARVIEVVQLPLAVDRRVLLDLRDLLSHPGHVVVVEVLAPTTLGNDAIGELTAMAASSPGSSLVVWMGDQRGGGSAGALLFALASVRVGEPGAASAAHRQSAAAVAALGSRCNGRCAQVVHLRLARRGSFQPAYPTLSGFLAAQPAQVRVVPLGVLGSTAFSRNGAPSSGRSSAWVIVLVVLLAVGATVGWYLALRGKHLPPRLFRARRNNVPAQLNSRAAERRPSPVRARTAPRGTGPLVPAVAVTAHPSVHQGRVRTELHPQGYVELDGCLYRATWTGSEGRGPRPGEPVRVTTDRSHRLVVSPVPSPASPSSPSTTADPSQPEL
jgi:hypothetical protein